MIDCKVCIHYDCCCGWTSKEVIDSLDEAVEEGTCRECNYYEPKKTGTWEKRTWIIFDSEKVGFNCSECNTTWDAPTKYCPNCGAKMTEE